MRKSWEYVVLLHGLWSTIGAVVVPLNTTWKHIRSRSTLKPTRPLQLFPSSHHRSTAMYCVSKYSWIPANPPSRPKPDSFMPPNGAAGSEAVPRLTATIPDSIRWATRIPVPESGANT
ncbi:hypothetical protein D0Z08_14610 [Nocardioides immobilis]|uniref:Uncharacterized protein n=1 Tax=Nocardioides immobilis TaxID=2049295 RepID=A0A417Y0S3_9ACTN|nr:hypothetical protein D0Z08_14610 [Nocardioides immobilis]